MSLIWDTVIPFSENILSFFNNAEKIETNYHTETKDFNWKNYLFKDSNYRRAHIEIVDARQHKKIWVMHMTIFPFLNDPSPIFGLDIVCGANKITGAFHDFSKMGDCNLYTYFQTKMPIYQWEKRRDLPDWAKRIFSPAMLAIGNINDEIELNQFLNLSIDNLNYYIYNVGKSTSNDNYVVPYNEYCKFQKMNPHTPSMMASIGVDEKLFKQFMDDTLFPEYYGNEFNNTN